MNLEDILDAQATGQPMAPTSELPEEWQDALAAHEALVHALGETVLVPSQTSGDRPPPELPADYTVVRELGRGGMGVVYLADQRSLGRQIAVKVLRPGELALGSLVRRFLDEARHLAKLRHPNIVSIHEVGTAGPEPYFTMDYIEGHSLAELLSEGPLAPSRAISLIKQVAAAVAYAHSQGIIHRDLKPANVLLTRVPAEKRGTAEHVFVSDFGLARDLSHDSQLTGSGAILGTPAYMAPEQARGQSQLVGEATDVHALGVILYEMLTGRPPYGRDAAADVLMRLLGEDPIAPRRLDRRIPRDLETVCLKAMAKRPEGRYASVQAFLSDIERWERGEPIVARRAGPLRLGARFLRRQWKVLTAVAVTAAVLLIAAPLMFNKSADELIHWGEEERSQGNSTEAVRLFHRAAKVATGNARRRALDLMLSTARESGDIKGLLDAALLIIQEEPDASFAEHDYLVAQALLGQLRARNLNGEIRWMAEEFDPLLRVAQRRLEIVLEGSQPTPEQRADAEQSLVQVRAELNNQPQKFSPWVEPAGPQLPEGTPPELLVQSADTARSPWQRGLAALSAARKLKTADDRAAEREAWRLALEQMRRVYPFYAGVGNVFSKMEKGAVTAQVSPSPASLWTKEAAQSLERLQLEPQPLTKGGIRFKIEGVKIPANMSVSLWVSLRDPDIAANAPPAGPGDAPSGDEVPVDREQSAFVGVVPGKYRLLSRSGMRSLTGSDHGDIYRRMILDFERLPTEVEIGSSVLEFTIPARLMQDIRLLWPPDGDLFDASRDSFRWTALPDAERYEIQFTWLIQNADGSTTQHSGERIHATEPRLRLGEVPKLPEWTSTELISGRTVQWRVEAFDAANRQIGISTETERAFIVAGELKQKPKAGRESPKGD